MLGFYFILYQSLQVLIEEKKFMVELATFHRFFLSI
jgi:hypothetical protein